MAWWDRCGSEVGVSVDYRDYMKDWLDEYFEKDRDYHIDFNWSNTTVWFRKRTDAMLFKLTWG